MNIHAKNIFWVYFFTFAAMPLGYLIRVMYAQNLSVEDYGVFYGLFGFFAVFEIVRSWALPAAINFYANRYIVKKEYNKVKTLFWFGHGFRFTLSILIVGLLYFFQDLIFVTFYPIEKHIKPMFNMFLFFWISQSFLVINSSFFGIFQNQKMNGFFGFFNAVLIITISFIGFNYLDEFQVPIFANLGASLIIALLTFAYFFNKYSKFLLKPLFHIKKVFFKDTFKFATLLIPSVIANTIFITTDIVIIQYFRGAEEVALYTTAVATSGLLLVFFTPMQKVINPLIAKLWHKGDKKTISKLLSLFLNNIFVIILPISLFVVIFSKNILLSIFGDNFVGAYVYLGILSAVIFLKGLRLMFSGVLAAIGEPKKITQIVLWTGSLNILGNLIFIQFWGTLGVVITTAFAFVFSFGMFLNAIHKQLPLFFDFKNLFKIVLLSLVFVANVLFLKANIYILYFQKPILNFAFNGGIIFVLSGGFYVALLFLLGVLSKKKFLNLKNLLLGKINI